MYFFDFDQESITEAGKYEAYKRKNDGSYVYFRYTVWYDVEYMIDGQKQDRSLRVVGTDEAQTITFIGKEATQFEPLPDFSELDTGSCSIGYSEKSGRLVLTFSFDDAKYSKFYYYFVLDGVKKDLVAAEAEMLVALSKTAIDNRYTNN